MKSTKMIASKLFSLRRCVEISVFRQVAFRRPKNHSSVFDFRGKKCKTGLEAGNVLQVIFGKQFIFCSLMANENKRHTLLTVKFKKESNQFIRDSYR